MSRAAVISAAEAERRGVADGEGTGPSNDAGGGDGRASDAGSASAATYPGTVMRKISRTRKPHVGVRGSAVVGFAIAADGSLSGVQILRFSGEDANDRAALDHLRRAAPFPAPPAPPARAERRFQVEYVSRG